MQTDKILENNQKWVDNHLKYDEKYFENLGKNQAPQVLYIGCSDSRVSAEKMMGAESGDIFIHRNIANMVISTDLSAMSVIEYAVEHLNVKKIIVCGHYNCGGVKAAMQPKDLGILNSWFRNIRDVYRLHHLKLDLIDSDENKYDKLVELNVEEQCINILKIACVQRAIHKNKLSVEGLIFDIKTGLLKNLNLDFSVLLRDIEKIYNLVH